MPPVTQESMAAGRKWGEGLAKKQLKKYKENIKNNQRNLK